MWNKLIKGWGIGLSILLAISAATSARFARAQMQPPALDPYIQILPDPQGYPDWIEIKNLYNSPLVALNGNSACTTFPEHTRARLWTDSAVSYVPVLLGPGKSMRRSFMKDCALVLAAVIFADGTAAGIDSEIERMYKTREYAVDEINRLLRDDIQSQASSNSVAEGTDPISVWDPARSIAFIESRAPKPLATNRNEEEDQDEIENRLDENGDRWVVQNSLIKRLQRLETSLNADPELARRQKGTFIAGLLHWKKCLTSKTFKWTDDFYETGHIIPTAPSLPR